MSTRTDSFDNYVRDLRPDAETQPSTGTIAAADAIFHGVKFTKKNLTEIIQRLAVQPERDKLEAAEAAGKIAAGALGEAHKEAEKLRNELYIAKSYLAEADKPFDVFKERDQWREISELLFKELSRRNKVHHFFSTDKALVAYEELRGQAK